MSDLRTTTVYLDRDLRADSERAADAWGRGRRGSLTPFLTWAIQQIVRLDFLSHENREFVLQIARELGQPWTSLAVLNLLASCARGDARAQKLASPFFAVNEEGRGNQSGQLFIDFPQTAPGGGPDVPSPEAIAPDRLKARGAARG